MGPMKLAMVRLESIKKIPRGFEILVEKTVQGTDWSCG